MTGISAPGLNSNTDSRVRASRTFHAQIYNSVEFDDEDGTLQTFLLVMLVLFGMQLLGIELDSATLVSASVEGILYGISVVLFSGTMWALVHGRPRDEVNRPMALVASVLTILSTIHLIVNIQRLIHGFIIQTEPGGPADFFADVTQNSFIVKTVSYILQTLLGDAIVIYRCFVVWRFYRFILLPAALWCAALLTSIGFLYNLSHITDPQGLSFPIGIGKWMLPFYLLTMLTNLVSSALLAYGIWTINRDEPGTTRVLSRSGIDSALLLRILVDAAALYALTLFVLLVFHTFQYTEQVIILDMMTPVVSITFYIVFIRIAVAKERFGHVSPEALSPVRFAIRVVPSPSEPRFAGTRRSSI